MNSLLLLILAAFFNAVMDAVENENVHTSIFKNWDPRFWHKRESWKYVRKIFGYRPDAWHLSKSLMIICMCLAMIFFDFSIKKWQDVLLYLVLAGIVWNVSFNIFYHKIFKVK